MRVIGSRPICMGPSIYSDKVRAAQRAIKKKNRALISKEMRNLLNHPAVS